MPLPMRRGTTEIRRRRAWAMALTLLAVGVLVTMMVVEESGNPVAESQMASQYWSTRRPNPGR